MFAIFGILVPPALLFKSRKKFAPYLSTAFLDITISPGAAAISCVSGPAPLILTPLSSLTPPPPSKAISFTFSSFCISPPPKNDFLLINPPPLNIPPNPLWRTCSCCSCGTPGVLPVSLVSFGVTIDGSVCFSSSRFASFLCVITYAPTPAAAVAARKGCLMTNFAI